MKKGIILIVCLTLFLSVLFTGCNISLDDLQSDDSVITTDMNFATSDDEMFTERDYITAYDERTAIYISLNGSTASSSSDKVKVSGSIVTIIGEGTFVISGTLDNGMIIVDAQEKDKPQIVLNGVSVTSETSAPLYIKEGDKVFVTLAENTQNAFSNGNGFTAIDENNIDGTIFSKQDITFNGNGVLTVNSPLGHGIVCKDDLVFTGGIYNLTALGHGIDANDSVRIKNSTLSITAQKDGIHVENSDDTSLGYLYVSSGKIDVSAFDDGISSGGFTQIQSGNFTINSEKQSSTDNTSLKGIKATSGILINGGVFEILSSDDTVHSNLSIEVNGGEFLLDSGDDAFHADEVLLITAGTIDITRSYEGLEALQVEISGGDINLVASDDGINAAGGVDSSGFGGMGGAPSIPGGHGIGRRSGERFGGNSTGSSGLIKISGGSIYIQASGDGIDANGNLEITGGYVRVCSPTSGDTAVLDYDGTGTISGGTFCGSGAYIMAQSLTSSDQGVIAINVGNQSANTNVAVKDSSGNTVVEYTPELSFQIAIISSPSLVKGQTYTLVIGSATKTVTA